MVELYRCVHHSAGSAVFVDGQPVVPAFEHEVRNEPHQHLPREGTPFFLDEEGRLDRETQAYISYLLTGEGGVVLSTVHSYVKDLMLFARFLVAQRSTTIWTAAAEDIAAYRTYRLEGPLHARLAMTSWVRALAALQRFYDWAKDKGRIQAPLRVRGRRDRGERGNKVRMITMPDYLIIRNVGLLGQGSGGAPDPDFNGRHPLRNAAFSECLIGAGLRRSEGNGIILGELPDADDRMFNDTDRPLVNGRAPVKMRQTIIDVPASITKGNVARRVPYSRRVALHFVAPYLREERPLLVERWRDGGGMAELGGGMILACHEGQGWLRTIGDARHRSVGVRLRTARLSLEERRRLVLLPNPEAPFSEAEPAMLWLGEDGRPMRASAWNLVFKRATERCARLRGISVPATPHTLRHTFAVYMLSALIKQQAGELEEFARLKRLVDRHDAGAIEAYHRIIGDPLRTLQGFMGHASQLTTQKYLTCVADAHRIVEESMTLFEVMLEHDNQGAG